jgi:multiple sugar transport system substrate-binding protein
MAWQFVKGMQESSTMLHITSLMYYLPTKPAVTRQLLKEGPKYTVFANETMNARARTQDLGDKYSKVSQAIWTAIQSALTGSQGPQNALKQAQSQVSSITGTK